MDYYHMTLPSLWQGHDVPVNCMASPDWPLKYTSATYPVNGHNRLYWFLIGCGHWLLLFISHKNKHCRRKIWDLDFIRTARNNRVHRANQRLPDFTDRPTHNHTQATSLLWFLKSCSDDDDGDYDDNDKVKGRPARPASTITAAPPSGTVGRNTLSMWLLHRRLLFS